MTERYGEDKFPKMPILSKTRRKYFKRIYYRKMETIMRSNTIRNKIKNTIIAGCLILSLVLGILLYLGR